MPKPKNRFEAAEKVLEWLKLTWPCGRPVRIKWKAQIRERNKKTKKWDNYYGETKRHGNEIVIYLSRRKCATWDNTIDTVIHEYVHARQWPMANVEWSIEDHEAVFWVEYGKMLTTFHNLGESA